MFDGATGAPKIVVVEVLVELEVLLVLMLELVELVLTEVELVETEVEDVLILVELEVDNEVLVLVVVPPGEINNRIPARTPVPVGVPVGTDCREILSSSFTVIVWAPLLPVVFVPDTVVVAAVPAAFCRTVRAYDLPTPG
jgi:hypothetical protein